LETFRPKLSKGPKEYHADLISLRQRTPRPIFNYSLACAGKIKSLNGHCAQLNIYIPFDGRETFDISLGSEEARIHHHRQKRE
jgi:hypothetical protein